MVEITPKGYALIRKLAKAQARDKATARTIDNPQTAARLYTAGILDKASRKPRGGSQTTVYWVTDAGLREIATRAGKDRR